MPTTLQATTIHDVLLAIVAAIGSGVPYTVFDGHPSKRPSRGVQKYLVIGAQELEDTAETGFSQSASMQQQWKGLGAVAREETVTIYCVAVGISTSISGARSNANDVLNDVTTNLPLKPTSNTYNALIDQVGAVKSRNLQGGAMAQIEFTITAEARITNA